MVLTCPLPAETYPVVANQTDHRLLYSMDLSLYQRTLLVLAEAQAAAAVLVLVGRLSVLMYAEQVSLFVLFGAWLVVAEAAAVADSLLVGWVRDAQEEERLYAAADGRIFGLAVEMWERWPLW